MTEVYKITLRKPRQRLIELCQSINYGSVENLRVENGDPVFDPPPLVTRDVKLGGNENNGPRPELGRGNFKLKAAVLQLFELFDDLGDGVVPLLEIKGGLPFRVLVQEQLNR